MRRAAGISATLSGWQLTLPAAGSTRPTSASRQLNMSDGNAPAGEDTLDPNDRLSLQIGRVARAHVTLDLALRSVHRTLATPGLAMYLTGGVTSTARLVADCREMLKKAAIDEVVIGAADNALRAAIIANDDRNRVVHDMWLFDSDLESTTRRLQSFQAKKGILGWEASERELTFVEDALTGLRRAYIRVLALEWALWSTLPFFSGSPNDERDRLPEWIAVMNDSFDLYPDGGFRAHSSS